MGALQTEALCWLRFTKKLSWVATEVGPWSADAFGVGPMSSIEIEVKVSIADFRRDFSHKKVKHFAYQKGTSKARVPNYFYFMVPEGIKDKALLALEELGDPRYGLLFLPDNMVGVNGIHGKKLEVARKAQKLHTEKPTQRTFDWMLLRMGSQICGQMIRAQLFQNSVMDAIDKSQTSMIEALEATLALPLEEE